MINTLKYLVYSMIIYILFSFIPNKKISLYDTLLLVTVITIFNLTTDLVELQTKNFVYEKFNSNKIIENLDNINMDDIPDIDIAVENLDKESELVNKKNTQVMETKDPNLGKKFEYGYSYLHTNRWSLPEKKPKVCKTKAPCNICSMNTQGFNPLLKTWKSN